MMKRVDAYQRTSDESNVDNLYIAGVLAAGNNANEIKKMDDSMVNKLHSL
jgi:hypothetical protein